MIIKIVQYLYNSNIDLKPLTVLFLLLFCINLIDHVIDYHIQNKQTIFTQILTCKLKTECAKFILINIENYKK